MTKFQEKSPTKYPIYFTDVVLAAAVTSLPTILGVKSTEADIWKLRDQFHEWRKNLRRFGLMNEVSKIEHDFRITTKIDMIPGPPKTLFEIYVTIKPKLIGTLHLLNPELMAEIDRD